MKKFVFFIIGAEKSGTSSLYNYLKQHPQIYMSSIKEPKFFAPEYERPITNMDDYLNLFEGVKQESAIGEASPQYLNSQNAHKLIKTYMPNATVIAIIRHPVDRVYSHYNMLINLGFQNKNTSFLQEFRKVKELYFKQSKQPLLDNYSFKQSFYFNGLSRYFEYFKSDQIKVYY